MNSEFYENVMDKLFSCGALDVYMTNIMMKKNRPAVKLSVLAGEQNVNSISEVIFKETSTIGIRKMRVEREILERKMHTIETIYGKISIKAAYRRGQMVNYAPEYRDVKEAAIKNKVPVKIVYNEAVREFLNKIY